MMTSSFNPQENRLHLNGGRNTLASDPPRLISHDPDAGQVTLFDPIYTYDIPSFDAFAAAIRESYSSQSDTCKISSSRCVYPTPSSNALVHTDLARFELDMERAMDSATTGPDFERQRDQIMREKKATEERLRQGREPLCASAAIHTICGPVVAKRDGS